MLFKFRQLLALFLIFSIFFESVAFNVTYAEVAAGTEEKRIEVLKKQIAERRGRIEEFKKNKAKNKDLQKALKEQILDLEKQNESFGKQIENLKLESANKQKEIDGLTSQINIIEQRLIPIKVEIAKIQEKIDKNKKSICIISSYEYRKLKKSSNLPEVLNSDNFADILRHIHFEKRLNKFVTSLFKQLRSDLAEKKGKIRKEEEEINLANITRGNILKNKQEIDSSQQQIEQAKGNIEKNSEERKSLIEKLDEENKDIDKNKRELEIEQRHDEEELEDIESKVKEAIGKHGYDRSKSSGKWCYPPLAVSSDRYYVSTTFKSGHNGVDFATYGRAHPVIAAADGTVAIAQKDGSGYKGYGNIIVLNHGNNITTRYAHLSRMNVKLGQEVHAGEVIGNVGNTGKVSGSTGIHLHFEFRVGGIAKNPASAGGFFEKGSKQTSEISDKNRPLSSGKKSKKQKT